MMEHMPVSIALKKAGGGFEGCNTKNRRQQVNRQSGQPKIRVNHEVRRSVDQGNAQLKEFAISEENVQSTG
jgi:hypothetical protein